LVAPIRSSFGHFADDYQYHIEHGSCPVGAQECF
jgi:hypothetical protein